ncbi:universal stress protein [Halomicrobium katesii]|uniref:universal stress protein n=1 Tax=Halomicrobium katesii TaxID=437163 RepID=UPI00035E44B1|nr:universal stress protein [Halomicrobium katesii]
MDIDLVLAPVDGSNQSEAAVEYALAIADAYDAEIHLLFVLDETLIRAIEADEVEADAIADRHQVFAAEMQSRLDERGHEAGLNHSTAAGFSPTRLRQSPGSVILDVAEDLDADFIVVPREPGSDDSVDAIGRAALYVIEYASQPVLSV